MYWIYSNKTHAVAIEHEADLDENDKPSKQLLAAVKAKAVAKFKAAGLPTKKVTMLTYFDGDELETADEPSDLFIPDQAVIDAARERLPSSEDLSIDCDAVLSCWNVQAWQYIWPTDVIEWMLEADPVPRSRGLNREQALLKGPADRLAKIGEELKSVVTTDGLEPYVIIYREEDETLVFHCQAESAEHAEEQLYDAHPGAAVVANTPALAPAIREALTRATAHAVTQD